jgi:hypothetical protein
MPVARFELPDGRIARFEVPAGTTPEQAQSMIQSQLSSMAPAQSAVPALPASLQPRQAPQQAAAPSGQAAPSPEGGGFGLFDVLSAPFQAGAQLAQKPRAEQVQFIAPAVEALGAGGGAMVGAPSGPMGAVAGAGMGYAGAKELLRLAAGNAPKETMGEAATRQATNVLEGATMEAGGRVASNVLGWGAGKVMDLLNKPTMRAAKIAKDAMGDKDISQAINALRNAKPGQSVAEVTASIENPAWQALVRDSLERSQSGAQYLRKFNNMTEQESVNALSKLVGGGTAAEARGVAETAKKNLNKITTPMREASLGRANLGKVVADEAAVREANEIATLVGSGQAIDPVRFAAQAKGAEKTLQSFGIKPLEGEPLALKIESISKNPQFAENDLIEGAANRVAEGIRKWTAENGVVDANALEAIRKNAVDAAIAKLRPGADATTQRNAAAGVMARIKPLIDDAIESSGGQGWRDYLTAHSQGMQRINEKKLTGEALRLWKTDKDAFVRLVQNESPDVVEKFLGPSNYNIAVELSDDTMKVLTAQAQKRINQLSASEQATEGNKALTTILNQNMSKFRLPALLNFWATTTNRVLSELEKALGPRTMKVLSERMQSPEGAANLLETLPAAESNKILKLMSDPSQWTGAKKAVTGTIAGTNALSSESYNENALTRNKE